MAERLHPLVEEVRRNNWNDGGFIRGDHLDKWPGLSPEDQALYLAARVGCPNALTLLKERGAEELRPRYARLDVWYGILRDQMKGTPLYRNFGARVDLAPFGGIGRHDENWVPKRGKRYIRCAETYHGYVLTRQLLDVLAKDPGRVFEAINRIRRCQTLDGAVVSMYFFSRELGYNSDFTEKRLFSSGYKEDKPEGYWKPIYKRVNERLVRSYRSWQKLAARETAATTV